MNWNNGHTTKIEYKTKSKREIPVCLVINEHTKEKLNTIKKKNHTHLDDYLKHGVIQFKKGNHSSLDGGNRGLSADGKRLSRKQYVNSSLASFKEKRNLKWQDFNYRQR